MVLLVPVDGSDCSTRAVMHIVKMAPQRPPAPPDDIHLVNVQPSLPGDVRTFVSREQIDRFHHDQGTAALNGAEAMLDAAGLPYRVHILVGEPGQEIAGLASSLHADRIVMGAHGRSAIAGMLMGSVSRKVLHLTSVPVLLVK